MKCQASWEFALAIPLIPGSIRMKFSCEARALACALVVVGQFALASSARAASHDVIVRNGMIYDGSGGAPYVGSVVIDRDRIVYVGKDRGDRARVELDAKGEAVAPGFINMLSWANESLMINGLGQSDLRQGVTLEVMGEGISMGPLNDRMAREWRAHERDMQYEVTWRSLGDYLATLEKRGVSLNVTSFVGATTVRDYVLGEDDVQPDADQLREMRRVVHDAMEQGAVGVASSLIYAPAAYARTPELTALAEEAGRCGGMYITHMRSEGDRLLEAVQETIDIARDARTPAEIYHFKAAGRENWPKFQRAIEMIEAARHQGVRVTANMYPYAVSAGGLDATMPKWVQAGGLDQWIARLQDPETRKRVASEMRDSHPDWENLGVLAGADGVMLLGFKNPALKPLSGKTVAEVARERGTSPEDAIIDLVIEDKSRGVAAYALMSEENVRLATSLPWVSFGSDAGAQAPEGIFLLSPHVHPRTYGTFARFLGKYVRDEHSATLTDAVRRLTGLPAHNLGLRDRGLLRKGFFADVVVFDPSSIADHATFEHSQQYATGVSDVWVNGQHVLAGGVATGTTAGRFVHGRAWTGQSGGGCRSSSSSWAW
jgi:N-acyl-D-amino-acid deacylase